MRRAILSTLALGLFTLGTGCLIIDDSAHPAPSYELVDLRVEWNIAGLRSPDLCSDYSVDRWIVEVRGPESRDVVLDCRLYSWSTENDLTLLPAGSYSVRVRALDGYGLERAIQGASVDLLPNGALTQMMVDFYGADFH